MKVIQLIVTSDGHKFETSQQASKHLQNVLSSGVFRSMYENLSDMSVFHIKNFLCDNTGMLRELIAINEEITEIEKLNIQ